MTPEERQLLTGLFERIRGQSAAPRDGDAEAFIAEAVRALPYAPYLLSQTVIVQDHALRAANERLQQLDARVQELEAARTQAPTESPAGGGSFLGSLGRSLFGDSRPPQAQGAPQPGPWGQTPPPPPQGQPSYPQQPSYGQSTAYAPQPSAAWGAPPNQPPPEQPQAWGAPQAPAGGGGFLKGALGAAAGVAGGVLVADSLRGLFSGGGANASGIAGGLGGLGGGLGTGLGSGLGGGAAAAGVGAGAAGGGETVVNNYYETPKDERPDALENADDRDDDDADVQDIDDDESGDGADNDDSYSA